MLKELEYLYHKIPDYRITTFLSINHPTYKEIVKYGEEKYITLLYSLCMMPDDYKSELDDAGYDWEKVDLISWFYTYAIPQLKEGQICNILFSSDITSYQIYENAETKERVLYNPMSNTVLTKNHIELIKEHINSMIGNIYKVHRECTTNEITKKILIDDDRQQKYAASLIESECTPITIKEIIMNILYNNYYEEQDGEIKGKIKVRFYSNETSDISVCSFRLGELSILEKIADDIYEYLKRGIG